MKLTCPRCSAMGEIFIMGQDTVAYRCPECGYVSDIMLSTEKNPYAVRRKQRDLENVKEQVAQLRSDGLEFEDIAYMLCVSRQTLYRWARLDEELRDLLGIKEKKVRKKGVRTRKVKE